jgi:hypothetical protein
MHDRNDLLQLWTPQYGEQIHIGSFEERPDMYGTSAFEDLISIRGEIFFVQMADDIDGHLAGTVFRFNPNLSTTGVCALKQVKSERAKHDTPASWRYKATDTLDSKSSHR